jgi:serine/threonine-protein kinase
MPAPTSVPDLIDRLRKSKLVPAERLEGFLAALESSGGVPTPDAMLDRLVAAGMITRFHADKLAAGKYKGFQLADDRYLILDQLGAGGMGQVFLAEHAQMRRLVALKVLNPHAFEHDAVARERFLREARAAGVLDHPNVVRIYDLCQDGKILFLVMEYVEGLSLQALVARRGPLGWPPPATTPARSPSASSTPTRWASSTATSSRRTCCWSAPGWSKSSTWGWSAPTRTPRRG